MDVYKDGRKIITPLHKLCMDLGLESMFQYLHKAGLQYTLSGNRLSEGPSTFTARIFVQSRNALGEVVTIREYKSTTSDGARVALANTLAKYLRDSTEDYHDHLFKDPSANENPSNRQKAKIEAIERLEELHSGCRGVNPWVKLRRINPTNSLRRLKARFRGDEVQFLHVQSRGLPITSF